MQLFKASINFKFFIVVIFWLLAINLILK